MNVVKLEMPGTQEEKENIIERIKNSNSCLVIFPENNCDEFWYQWINMAHADVIVACETVKAHILKKVIE